jgi:hypothetical protein
MENRKKQSKIVKKKHFRIKCNAICFMLAKVAAFWLCAKWGKHAV